MTPSTSQTSVAIVDYGVGNLFSVARACQAAGLDCVVTSDPTEVRKAPGVILPGVGAFGDAMAELHARGLTGPLRETAAANRPLLGVCLGMQLLLSESHEFGRHQGLGIIPGSVVRLNNPREGKKQLKVPQVGWNKIQPTDGCDWKETLLVNQTAGAYMYFVHSFCAVPADDSVRLCTTAYGDLEFCSGVKRGNTTAFQFHPEKSGPAGLDIYKQFARQVAGSIGEKHHAA